jgi:hypothetical protein
VVDSLSASLHALFPSGAAASGASGASGRGGSGSSSLPLHPLTRVPLEELRAALQMRLRAMQSDHDDIVASECCLCGALLVNSIDVGLEDMEDDSWDL